SFAKEIVEDKLSVKMLVPVAESIHGYEATSQDMIDIENAKLFLFTSLDIDTWITNPDTIGGDDTIVLNMSDALIYETIDTVSDETTDEHDHGEDAHYWVDPSNAIYMVEYILEGIIEIDPDESDFYTQNAEALIGRIEAKSNEMLTYFNTLDNNSLTIYVAGHNAFALLGEHFGLNMTSIFDEYEPDADITSSELINFVSDVLDAQTHYIFIEALEAPTSANAIKTELKNNNDFDLTILKLYAYQNVTQDQYDSFLTYVDFMEMNFQNIKLALGDNL
ncbi:MAG: metal ABC transporter substrate-binding protein, partial [Acholeplasmataceae bacterium]